MMARLREPFLHDDDVVIPRQYIHNAGGSVTVRDTVAGVAVESTREKKLLQESSGWSRFSDQDPFLSLLGSFEDDASDVSQNKYTYLADAYRP